jgi:hypothetical protein
MMNKAAYCTATLHNYWMHYWFGGCITKEMNNGN